MINFLFPLLHLTFIYGLDIIGTTVSQNKFFFISCYSFIFLNYFKIKKLLEYRNYS